MSRDAQGRVLMLRNEPALQSKKLFNAVQIIFFHPFVIYDASQLRSKNEARQVKRRLNSHSTKSIKTAPAASSWLESSLDAFNILHRWHKESRGIEEEKFIFQRHILQ